MFLFWQVRESEALRLRYAEDPFEEEERGAKKKKKKTKRRAGGEV